MLSEISVCKCVAFILFAVMQMETGMAFPINNAIFGSKEKIEKHQFSIFQNISDENEVNSEIYKEKIIEILSKFKTIHENKELALASLIRLRKAIDSKKTKEAMFQAKETIKFANKAITYWNKIQKNHKEILNDDRYTNMLVEAEILAQTAKDNIEEAHQMLKELH